ncbi:hypothetical protein BDR06DRAFT_949308 [Suillus hirtellus]|nr:hypothetical protein BDR06DRAFT_949308 [Suillus hirtellus]
MTSCSLILRNLLAIMAYAYHVLDRKTHDPCLTLPLVAPTSRRVTCRPNAAVHYHRSQRILLLLTTASEEKFDGTMLSVGN